MQADSHFGRFASWHPQWWPSARFAALYNHKYKQRSECADVSCQQLVARGKHLCVFLRPQKPPSEDKECIVPLLIYFSICVRFHLGLILSELYPDQIFLCKPLGIQSNVLHFMRNLLGLKILHYFSQIR